METPAFSVHTGRFPSVEQQVRQIEERVQALYAGEITIPADVVDEVLRAGGNRKGSIPRIIYNFMPGKTDGEYTEFIRKEYGTGGRGIIIGGMKYSVWHDELGMQIAAIEWARHVLGYADANSREFDEASQHLVIDLMPDQQGNLPKGGTMRLGAYPCRAAAGSKLLMAYGQDEIAERHRHRYEFNNVFREAFEASGAVFSGLSPDGRLVEALELPSHDFYVGVQYHPEFKSRPNKAHPLFREFIRAGIRYQEGRAK